MCWQELNRIVNGSNQTKLRPSLVATFFYGYAHAFHDSVYKKTVDYVGTFARFANHEINESVRASVTPLTSISPRR